MSSQTNFQQFYIASLYVVVGLLLAVNVIVLLGGVLIAVIPIVVQSCVLIGVYFRKNWSWIMVIIWAAIAMMSGLAMWAAIILRGGDITLPMSDVVLRSAMLVVGLFFLVFAKQVLRPSSTVAE